MRRRRVSHRHGVDSTQFSENSTRRSGERSPPATGAQRPDRDPRRCSAWPPRVWPSRVIPVGGADDLHRVRSWRRQAPPTSRFGQLDHAPLPSAMRAPRDRRNRRRRRRAVDASLRGRRPDHHQRRCRCPEALRWSKTRSARDYREAEAPRCRNSSGGDATRNYPSVGRVAGPRRCHLPGGGQRWCPFESLHPSPTLLRPWAPDPLPNAPSAVLPRSLTSPRGKRRMTRILDHQASTVISYRRRTIALVITAGLLNEAAHETNQDSLC